MYRAGVRRSFSAAHALEGHEGKCASLHGHTWTVEAVFVSRDLDRIGMSIDFDDAASLLDEAIAPYDHAFLNELDRFATENPTAENVARWIFEDLARALESRRAGIGIEKVTVWESADACASFSND